MKFASRTFICSYTCSIMKNEPGTVNPDLLALEHKLFGSSLQLLRLKMENDPRLSRAWNYCELYYSQSCIDLGTVSRECGMSKNSMNQLLKRITGRTYGVLMRGYRVYRSICDATSRDCSITELALTHGFDSSSNYSRVVRSLTGIAPRSLLRQGRDHGRQAKTHRRWTSKDL